MTAALARRTLVLNANYLPLATWPLSIVSGTEAIKAVFRGRASVVEEWSEVFRSPSIEIRVPKVVALNEFASINAEPKFCRRSILLRDRFRCQYCGIQFPSHELTFDHVIPRASGGQTTWENILSCCVPCNVRKRSEPANWSGRKGSGLRPLKAPRRPTAMELLRAGMMSIDIETRETWGSFLYWSSSLEP